MHPFVCSNVASPFYRTLSQAYLSKRAKRRIGLSATPVVNRPLDLAGICTALNAPDYLQSKSYWSVASLRPHHLYIPPQPSLSSLHGGLGVLIVIIVSLIRAPWWRSASACCNPPPVWLSTS